MTEDEVRRVLIITRNMPPLWGGMEQLNWHMADQLVQRAAVQLVGPTGSAQGAPVGVGVTEVPLKPLPRFLCGALWVALRLARRWRPQLVLAGSGLTAPLAWLAARFCGAKAAVYVHGLDVTVDHPVYRGLWIPALRHMDCVIANSHVTAKLAEQMKIEPARISIVNPGVNLPTAPVELSDITRLRAEQNWGTRPILLSVGRLTKRKGLREFVMEVLPKIVVHRPNVLLVVVGDVPANSLLAESQTPESIKEAARTVGVIENLVFLGVITDRGRLASIYQAADVHVFPVRDIPNDPEGFGMVAVEAAAYGVPTVGYATGGVTDAVAEGVSGYLLKPGDNNAFAASVLHLLDNPLPENGIRAFAEKFAWVHFGNQLVSKLPVLGREGSMP
jgi:phosphatidyl-myo-inositol dimannoside synthase